MRLILASRSPRRAEILRQAGIDFETLPVDVDESVRPDETPLEHVRRLADLKAQAAAAQAAGPALVLGADTVVLIDGLVLGKPASAGEARQMLRRLAGRTHEVATAVAVVRLPERTTRVACEVTAVTFAPLTADEIEDYVASGEPFEKAGGYALQGRAGRFATRIEGCYFNVVGLPLAYVYRLLREMGWEG